MVHHGTLRRLDAGVLDAAGVDAVVVVARLLGRTVEIRPAVNGEAGHVRITFKTRRTGADGFMADGLAGRFSSAGQVARTTHRSALLVPAGVGV